MQKYIVRILAGAALLLSQFQTQAQQELMLSQMPDVWQMNSINPSFFPESKRFALGLPGIAIDAAHSGTATYNDFLRKENGKTVYDATPEQMAATAKRLLATGARIIGGCCGTTPMHLAAMSPAVHSKKM